MQALLGQLGAQPAIKFLWGVLGGQTDYPLAIAINALLNMIPAAGLAFDVMSLLFDPSIIKVLALFAVITGLGEVTIILPVVGQVTGPGSFVGDKAIAVTQATYKLLRAAAKPLVKVADNLGFKAAVKLVTNVLEVLLKLDTCW